MTRRIRAALLACSLTWLLLPGCSSSPDASDGEELATIGAGLTTADAVSRAEQWVTAKLHYCQAANHQPDYDAACSSTCNRTSNALWDPYRSDCSGLVSWAWGLAAPGRVTSQFAPYKTDITHVIPAASLAPGDAVNNSHHVMLFKEWTVGHTQARFIEEPGCSSSTPYAHELTSNVTLSGNSITVAWSGDTFTAIRYGALTAPPPPNVAPRGHLDEASCTALGGWAQDPDKPTATVGVKLTFDGPATTAGVTVLKTTANIARPDLCTPLGSCNHAFRVAPPIAFVDGKPHTVHAYGLDTNGTTTTLLTGAPKTFTCTPPAPAKPPGPGEAADGGESGGAVPTDPAFAPPAPSAVETPQGSSAPSGEGCAASPRAPSPSDPGLVFAGLAILALARGRRRGA